MAEALPLPAPTADVRRRLKILYVGPDAGTCRARRLALERLGHDAFSLDPFAALPEHGLARSWSFKSGGLGLGGLVRAHIRARCAGSQFDLAYVDSGELIGPATVALLREFAPVVVNYNPDNPYSTRDGWRWRAFMKAVPLYDHLFVPRISNVEEALAAGARRVSRVWFAADDKLRDPANLPDDEAMMPYRAAVSFVGTWMPERAPIMLRLIEAGLPVRIFGPRWTKAPEYSRLAHCTDPRELSPQAFDAAVAAADISIALLSKGNRDLHTTRSLEIPTLGSLLCGERTDEHRALYDEGEEAVFWSDVEECISICRDLITDTARRRRIAAAGRRRALANDHFNEPLMHGIIEEIATMSKIGPQRTISCGA